VTLCAGSSSMARGENRPPLVAHVIPLVPIRTVAIFDLDRPAAAVFVVDPAAGLSAQIQRFAARFGLTVAEAFLRKSLVETGFSPPPRGSKSPRRRRAATRTAFWRRPEPPARRSSSAGFLRPPCPERVRRPNLEGYKKHLSRATPRGCAESSGDAFCLDNRCVYAIDWPA
jgi:hypothetical protein